MAAPSNPSAATEAIKSSSTGLTTHIKISSEQGLSSISTLIVGAEACILVDPPFLIPDAEAVCTFIRETTKLPLLAVFVTHHHPDHFFSANVILEAWPEASFFAAPYVRAGIDREYEEKIKFWPTVYPGLVPEKPRKPDVYPFSFTILPGNANSPIVLLGPVQGDTVDHSLFWLPKERTIITGDCMYARSTHVWAEEIETPHVLEAWRNIITMIEGLDLEKIIPGHLESGWELDKEADLAHNRKYLDLFATKIAYAKKQPGVKEVYDTFEAAFPECKANLGFFLGKLSNQFGDGGEKWEENHHHAIGERRVDDLEAYVVGNSVALAKKRQA